MLTKQMMRQGKPGLFGMIERSTNLRNSRVFVAMNVILFAISLVVRFTVRELEMGPLFMWLSAGMLLVSLVELLTVQRKEGAGNHLKWIIGISFVVSAVVTTSTLGGVGSMIYGFSLLLSIPYCSVLYSVLPYMMVFAALSIGNSNHHWKQSSWSCFLIRSSYKKKKNISVLKMYSR